MPEPPAKRAKLNHSPNQNPQRCWKCENCNTINLMISTIADSGFKCYSCGQSTFEPDKTFTFLSTAFATPPIQIPLSKTRSPFEALIHETLNIEIPSVVADIIQDYENSIMTDFMIMKLDEIAGWSHYVNFNEIPTNGQFAFEREQSNTHDSNAIKVLTDEETHVGYIPSYDAAILAPLIDNGQIEILTSTNLNFYSNTFNECRAWIEIIPTTSNHWEDIQPKLEQLL
eukprot:371034_1